MMKLVFASLLPVLASVTATPAQPAPPAPPPLATPCAAPSGKVVFESDVTSDTTVPGAKSVTKLFANGTWVRTSPKVVPQVGCVDPRALARLEQEIAAAPWTITHPQFRCMARSRSFSEYKIGGIVYRSELCGNDVLDAKSTAVLAHALALVSSKP